MSLNWNLTKIANSDQVCWVGPEGKETLNPVTEALIWLTMGIDLGQFTEKNIEEVIFRLRYYSKCFGKPLRKVVKAADGGDDLVDLDLTIEEIRAHIGLSVNVINESRSKFMRNCSKRLEGEIEDSIRWEKEKAETKKDQSNE